MTDSDLFPFALLPLTPVDMSCIAVRSTEIMVTVVHRYHQCLGFAVLNNIGSQIGTRTLPRELSRQARGNPEAQPPA